MACDPCKLRRVKCDLLALLSASSNAEVEDEPAHVLVRRNPGVPCSNCRNKGLQCSTEGILNPIRPNKGGKRIEEARKRFGGDAVEDDGQVAGGEGQPPSKGEPSLYGTEPLGGPSSTPFLDFSAFQQPQAAHQPLDFGHSTGAPINGIGIPTDEGVHRSQSQEPWLLNSDATLFAQFLAQHQPDPLPSTIPAEPQPTSISLTPNLLEPLYTRDSDQMMPTPRDAIQQEATDIWRKLSVNTPQTIAARSLRPPTPQPPMPAIDDMAAHTPHPYTLIPALGRLDIETNQFMPILPVHDARESTPSDCRTTWPSGYVRDDPSVRSDQVTRHTGISGWSAASQNGKRQRMMDSTPSTPGSNGGKMTSWERDPWHIWQSPEEREQSLIAWGRKEQVQESLADRALGVELSRHLITVYFQAVHFSLPVSLPSTQMPLVAKARPPQVLILSRSCRQSPSTWNGRPAVAEQTA